MDNVKKFEDFLDRMQELLDNAKKQGHIIVRVEDLEKTFPELKESEDERVRNKLIEFFKGYSPDEEWWGNITQEDILAWLEKQGEHANFRNKIQVGDKVTRNKDGVLVNLSQLKRIAKPAEEYNITGIGSKHAEGKLAEKIKELNDTLENQGEQKPYGQRQECVDCQFNYAGECKGYCAMKRGEQKDVNIQINPSEYINDMGGNGCYLKNTSQKPTNNQFTPEQANILDKHIDKFLEQKPADKVEPKFKVGDWVVYDHNAYQIVKLPKESYINLSLKRNGKIEFAPSTYCRPWTIQDAKAGDVLATENFIFIFKNIDNGNGVHYYCHYEIRKHEDDSQFGVALPQSLMGRVGNSVLHYSPATKEQCDLLFQKMKEAGYEWDAEKKELKKISQEYPLTPDECIKPAWSEEDENMFENTIGLIEVLDRETKGAYITKKYIKYLKSLKDRIQPKQEWSEEDKEQLDRALYMMEQLDMTKSWDDVYNWLKLLKYRFTWKPSDEQIEALSAMKRHCEIATSFDAYKQEIVESLYQDLKKLKG